MNDVIVNKSVSCMLSYQHWKQSNQTAWLRESCGQICAQ